jgi:hypothetical protein
VKLEQTFKEFIEFSNTDEVQYLIVSGYAVGSPSEGLMAELVDFGFGEVGVRSLTASGSASSAGMN